MRSLVFGDVAWWGSRSSTHPTCCRAVERKEGLDFGVQREGRRRYHAWPAGRAAAGSTGLLGGESSYGVLHVSCHKCDDAEDGTARGAARLCV